ncbi:hypothetical protein D3D02_15335 [Halobellus sp. Atlit-38R]|uniref:hypothetical protein n=1 Tax=Halobellus sp. Atlit-38R TaxID=2282131 RepID=UPI000EF27CF1|nr:hypothetical protein [Halobellus sp. Atlit-38R]RLM84071.1 hypothetical protein D3D02_15335 [Halobellus sp. Atlit-38R]
MTDEGRSGGADDAGADPFDVELPPGWSAQRRDGTTAYQNGSGDHRVRIVEFSKGLSLYWWVDVYVYDEEWEHREVGLGDSYTDPEDAASAVETYIERVAQGGTTETSDTGADVDGPDFEAASTAERLEDFDPTNRSPEK